jgi:hypothetical protein
MTVSVNPDASYTLPGTLPGGLPAQDVWSDVEAIRSWHQELVKYPTQKPEALIQRIIEASSN